MGVQDLVFTKAAEPIYGPVKVLEVDGAWIETFKVENLGEDTLDQLGVWIRPATNLGTLTHPISKTPDEDYQDLLTWGEEETGGIRVLIPTALYTEITQILPLGLVTELDNLKTALNASAVDVEDLDLRDAALLAIAAFCDSVAALGQALQVVYEAVLGRSGWEAVEASALTLLNLLDSFVIDFFGVINSQHSQGFDLASNSTANLVVFGVGSDPGDDSAGMAIDPSMIGNPSGLGWSGTGFPDDASNLAAIILLLDDTIISGSLTPETVLTQIEADTIADISQGVDIDDNQYIVIPTSAAPVEFLINRTQGCSEETKLPFRIMEPDDLVQFIIEFEPVAGMGTRRLYVDFVLA